MKYLSTTLVSTAVVAAMACTSALAFPEGPHGHPGPHGMPGQHSKVCPSIKHTFMKVDTDRDMVLDSNEQKAFSTELLKDVTEKQKLIISFKDADTDKNGFITYDELVKVMPAPPKMGGHPNKPNKPDVKPNDQKPRGDRPEKPQQFGHHEGFGPGPHDMNQPPMPPMDPVLMHLHMFDKDRDFKLSEKEYNDFNTTRQIKLDNVKFVANNIAKADLNNDGVVTMQELKNFAKQQNLKTAPAFKKERPAPAK